MFMNNELTTASLDEIDSICSRFQVIVEEFGHENVIIALPKSWQSYTNKTTVGDVTAEFCTDRHILIRASHSGGVIEYSYIIL